MIKNEDFTVTEVVCCFRKKSDIGYKFESKGRALNGITLIISGGYKLVFEDGSVLNAKSGDIVFNRKGDTYNLFTTYENTEFISISYQCEPNDFAAELVEHVRHYSTKELYPRYLELFCRTANDSNVKCATTLLRATVQEILCYLVRDAVDENTRSADGYISTAQSYIRANYQHPINVADIARASYCSPSHLRHLFDQMCGISPNKYLCAVRIEQAQAMLLFGMFSLKEVALKCGFKNVYYFCRVFKEHTGYTPGEYRRVMHVD